MMSYCDEATAAVYKDIFGGEVADYVGWWYDGYEPGDPEGAANGYEVGLGDGFMGLFGSFNEIQFTSAGQAPTASTSFVVNPDGTEKPIFANYIPRRLPLKYIAPVDGTLEYGTDSIQVINPTTQDADYMMSYCDETTAVVYQDIFGGDVADYVGWWFDGYDPGDPEGSAAGYPVEAGAAFMGLFGAYNEIELQMPSSLITIDDSEFVDPE